VLRAEVEAFPDDETAGLKKGPLLTTLRTKKMDTMTTVLLGAIAVGLWINAAAQFARPAKAQEGYGGYIVQLVEQTNSVLGGIHHTLNNIAQDSCSDKKIWNND
jgi:hypothetical protein